MTDRKVPDERQLILGGLTREVVGAFYDSYNELGFGFLESVYRRAMVIELRERGLQVDEEVPIAVNFRGVNVGHFRLDLLVEHRVAVEVKATTVLGPTDKRQLLNYLRATDLRIGLLLHFGPEPAFHRLASPRILSPRTEQIRPFPPKSV